MKSICVYCGSADNVHPEYLAAAEEMGALMAAQGLEVVFGAGSTGLMGAVANGALKNGGQVTGVITEQFNTDQLAHRTVTRFEVVRTMHQRKARLAELADAFIALPGGYGTFEEFFEALTWAQIGLHRKPMGLLNTRQYYAPLMALVDHARQEGFIYAEHRSLFTIADEPAELLAALKGFHSPDGLERWLTRPSGSEPD